MKLGNCSILIVHPLDEHPPRDPNSGVMIQYQHGGIYVGVSSLSSEFKFRCVTSLQSYNIDNEVTYYKSHPVFDTDDLQKKFDHNN